MASLMGFSDDIVAHDMGVYDAQWLVLRAAIADRTGWTLDYIDTLSEVDVESLLAYWQFKAMRPR